jgi:hypothetical protein
LQLRAQTAPRLNYIRTTVKAEIWLQKPTFTSEEKTALGEVKKTSPPEKITIALFPANQKNQNN